MMECLRLPVLYMLCLYFGVCAGWMGGRASGGRRFAMSSAMLESPRTSPSSSPSPSPSPLSSSSPLFASGIVLPTLSRADRQALLAGERIQRQERTGRSGYGIVVVDVPCAPDVVFECLTKFDKYMDMIPTVRSVKIFSSNDKNTLAEFSLSKFCLKVNVMHTVLREQRVVKFSLDNSRPNLVMRQAEGFWHVQAPTDRPEGYSRVYLSSNIVASRLVPVVIVDYAAARALPRATTWLQEFDFSK